MIIEIEQSANEFLEHFGVKGQKWGVRRAREINAKRAAKGKATLKSSQYIGNKATRGAAYVASYMIGSGVANTAAQVLTRGNLPISALAGIAGGAGATVATNKILTRAGNKRLIDVLEED